MTGRKKSTGKGVCPCGEPATTRIGTCKLCYGYVNYHAAKALHDPTHWPNYKTKCARATHRISNFGNDVLEIKREKSQGQRAKTGSKRRFRKAA